ncbi:neprilysin-1-like isoform X2 [Dermacentor albipictus]|uniref:neprilysin-1-like isoform X2 n=1 Tax=Dermacentor albipictus TaxID=60249 RepID=UPI0031FCBE40
MEWGQHYLRQQSLPNHYYEEAHYHNGIILPLICLFVVVLGVSCSTFLIAAMLSEQPPDESILTVDTLATFHVRTTTTPDIKRPGEDHKPGSSPAPLDRSRTARFAQADPSGGVCASFECRYAGQWVRSKIDDSVDPCKDFYKFVCGSFEGYDEYVHAKRGMLFVTRALLSNFRVPSSNQNSHQKAAGMYQTCVAFARSIREETTCLVTWMLSLNLDLLNETRLAAVNPVKMMVRGSLDLGVTAVLAVVLLERTFDSGKRRIKIEYSKELRKWLGERRKLSKSRNLNDYVSLLRRYGVNPPHDTQLASKIIGYEEQLPLTMSSWSKDFALIYIRFLGNYTKSYVTSDEWGTFFFKYTNGTYGGSDYIYHQPLAIKLLVRLFKSKWVGANGLRYLVAWSIYRQLLNYTVPQLLFGKSSPSDHDVKRTCHNLVQKVMNLAVKSLFFQSQAPSVAVDRAQGMLTRMRRVLRQSFESSSWLTGRTRRAALRKLDNLTTHVGSGNRLDLEFVENLYKPYPDALPDHLFAIWIKALSLSTHYMWSDTTSWLYDEVDMGAFYNFEYNTLAVARGLLLRPFFYVDGPLGLNYGGLGMLSLSARQEVLDDYTDSENLADLVGTRIAYETFASLSPAERNVTLAGLDMSPERLFFFNHCVKMCHQQTKSKGRYASYRSRCIVPLMNMPEFASTYGCAAGEPMNPRTKCNFWQ